MNEEEEILGKFLLVNDYRILTNEELEDVKKAINNLQQENTILKENAKHNDKVVDKVNWENNLLKQQLKDKDEKISKVIEYCLNEREDINGSKCDDILEILESNIQDLKKLKGE